MKSSSEKIGGPGETFNRLNILTNEFINGQKHRAEEFFTTL